MADYFPNGGLDNVDIPFEFGMAEATTEYALHAQRLTLELKTEYDHCRIDKRGGVICSSLKGGGWLSRN